MVLASQFARTLLGAALFGWIHFACTGAALAQTCIPISTVQDLQNISQNLAGNYCLANDIDASCGGVS
jgi:hypothetical protein